MVAPHALRKYTGNIGNLEAIKQYFYLKKIIIDTQSQKNSSRFLKILVTWF